ncbi:hypothetical protein L1887_36488 [Cichorium endivia]|nr:hypothetical protein L1887_36488 [Cichorium endivia]
MGSRKNLIIRSKVESVSADDYSWKKYDEKEVTDHPSQAKGCPTRKQLALSVIDLKMLVVTLTEITITTTLRRWYRPASFSDLKYSLKMSEAQLESIHFAQSPH